MNHQNTGSTELEQYLKQLETTLRNIHQNGIGQRLLRELEIQRLELEMQSRNLLENQQKVTESCHRFCDSYDFAPIGFVSLDSKGLIHQINPAAADLLGIARTDLIRTPLALYLPNDSEAFFRHLKLTLNNDRREMVELQLQDSNQRLHYVRMYSVSRREGKQGKICTSALVDITEHREQQQTLQLQNTMLNQMQEGVLLIRRCDGVILETNAAVDLMFGYTPGELAGRHVSVLNAGGERESCRQAEQILAELKCRGKWHGEVHNVRKNGTDFWSEVSISAFDHQDYGPIWLDVHRNISVRKATECALRESDRFAHGVINALPVQLVVLDQQGDIVAVNKMWREFALDYHLPAVLCEGVGMNYQEVCLYICGEFSPQAKAAMAGIDAVIKEEQPLFTMEFACHASQQSRWFLLNATSRGNGDKGAVVTYIDITSRKLAEAQAGERRDELARVMRLNTVSALSSALAHEITQPLTAISCFSDAALSIVNQDIGNQELTKQDVATNGSGQLDQLRQVLQDIDHQVQRASVIMQRLREFMGHGRAQTACVDINEIIDNAVTLVKPMARKHQIAITRLYDAVPRYVLADRIQIEQVFVNLLHNSIEAINSAPGKRRDIFIEHVGRGNGQVEFAVRDTGPGLDSQMIERIFDIFETDKKTGMGMGLSISRSMVEAHHGKLWVEDSAGPGAVFHLSLPTGNKEAEDESL